MKFSKFMIYSAIQADLASNNKSEAIREMLTAIAAAGVIAGDDLESCILQTLKREELCTSGIGNGFAVPVTVYANAPHAMASLFLSQKGINFESLDDSPAHMFLAVIKQPKDPKGYLQLMEYFSRAMQIEAKWNRLQNCKSRHEILDWLDAIDTVIGSAE